MWMLHILILHLLNWNHPQAITTTQQLVAAMQKQYQGKWARTLTFTQYNTHFAADTIKDKSIWYEAIEYPANFRIDFGLPKEGNGIILTKDSIYSFKNGELKTRRFRINNLILLAGGMHFYPQAEVLKRMKEAGYNPEVFREDNWQGKPVYVVGAPKGDTLTAQCWFDREKLYLVRTLTPTSDGHMQDARFRKHIRTAGGWTETEVLFLKDGKKEQLEKYENITPNVVLPAGLFDPEKYGNVHWMK
jgi:hypothetical protein